MKHLSKHRVFLFEKNCRYVRVNNKRVFIYIIIIFGLFKNNSFLLSFSLIATKHSCNKLWKILNIHNDFVFIQDLTFSSFVRLYNFVLSLVSPRTFHIHSIHGRRRIEQVSCPRHLFKQKLLPRFLLDFLLPAFN